jgi:hypothetical protein
LVLGVETGVGYALSDENNSIGLGFISKYNGKRSLDRARNILVNTLPLVQMIEH